MDETGRAESGTKTKNKAWSSLRYLCRQLALLGDGKAGYFGRKIPALELSRDALVITRPHERLKMRAYPLPLSSLLG